jgi:multiple sugar transport system permease protein
MALARAVGRRQQGPARPRRALRRIAVAYALMAPALVLVLAVLAYPLAWEAWVSLTDFSSRVEGRPTFVGLANYQGLLADAEFWRALTITIGYFAVTTLAKLGLGIAMALLLARPSRARAFVFLAIFLPWAYPGGVTVVAWYWMLNPPLTTSYSVLAGNAKHAVDGLFGGGAYAFLSVMLFNIWRGASFTAVFLLAGLNAIPTELFEYAQLETQGAWQRFWRVTVPLLTPYIALAVFLSFTTAFADLGNVWMLTGGRVVFPVIGTHAYWLGIQSGQFSQAATWSLSLVPLLAVALILLFRWFDPPEERAA